MRRSHVLLVVFALALVAAFLAIWFGSEREVAIAAAPSDSSSAVEREALSKDVAGRAESPATRDEAVQSEVVTVPAAAPELDADATQIDVRVVLPISRRPIAHAVVRWWTPREDEIDEPEKKIDEAVERSTLDELLGDHFETFTADAEGRVMLAVPPRGGWAFAQGAGRWGWERISPRDADPVYVELQPDFDVAARVVDSAGAPLSGVHVSVREHLGEDSLYDFLTATSDAHGIARLQHAGVMITNDGIDLGEQLSIALAEPLDPRVEVPFEFDAPPREPVELVVPACGALEVALLDPEGALHAEPIDVGLQIVQRNPRDPEDFELLGPTLTRRTANGVAVFSCVALGREFHVWVNSRDSEAFRPKLAFGPKASGARARIELQSRTTLRGALGRVLDEHGAPLANAKLSAKVRETKRNSESRLPDTRTDDDGRFQIANVGDLAGAWELSLTLTDSNEIELARGSARLPERIPAGTTTELGDIQLVALPLLVAGRVIDASGKPVRGASVSALEMTRSEGRYPRTRWQRVGSARIRSDASGRFEVRGTARGASLTVQASAGDASGETLEVAVGGREVEVRLEASGSIEGRIEFEPATLRRMLHVSASLQDVVPGTASPTSRRTVSEVDESGVFALRGLRPGRYTLEVGCSDASKDLARVTDVFVIAGEATRDPRLDPLRVEQKALVLRVVDEVGQRVSDGRVVAFFHDTPKDEPEWLWLSNGEALLVTDLPPVDLTIGAEGFVTTRVPSFVQSGDVVLQHGPHVRFQLAPDLRPPEAPWELHVSLAGVDEPDWLRWLVDDEFPIDERGSGEGIASRIGTSRVHLQLVHDLDDEQWSFEFDVETERTCVLDGRSGEQRVEIRFDQAALQRAIEDASREEH